MKNIEDINKAAIKKIVANRKIIDFSPGDTIKVGVKIIEGKRERIQYFEGVCIAKKNRDINSSFTVRKISFGEGVERTFALYSPNVDSIKVIRSGKVRRAKLYYLRNRKGKSERIAEKISAEMATVLRRMATTLIRLREKLELQLCTVFHSARYPIILTRNAYQTQDDARSRFRSSRLHTITRQDCSKSNIQSREYKTEHNREARSCTSCITSTYSGSLFRKRNSVTT